MATFSEVLEIIDDFSIYEQIEIANILNKRIIELRREELFLEVQDAKLEFQNKTIEPTSIADIMKEIRM